MPPARSPLLSLLLACPVAAQVVRWQLPEGGAVRYTAAEQWTCKSLDGGDRNAAPPHGSLPHAAVLLANELAPDGRSTTVRLVDARWLAPRLAFDLRTFGAARAIDEKIDDFVPFGTVRLTGRVEAADADGWQKMALRIASAEPAPGKNDDADGEGQVRRVYFDSRCTGTLVLQRRVDAGRGVVAEFSAEVALDNVNGPRAATKRSEYRLTQTWRLHEVLARRGPGFEQRVADAIQRGKALVKYEITIPDRGVAAPLKDHPHGEGHLALGVLTLLHAEVPSDDAVVRQAFYELRRREVRETYSQSLALLAVERRYAPLGERDQLLSGARKQPAKRDLSEDDFAAMKKWTDALLAGRDTSVRPDYTTRWRYTGPGWDNSNTQYGVLGLHSAELCGRPVGRTTWFAVANHWLAERCDAEGDPVPVVLEPIGAGNAQAQGTGKPRTRADRRVAPRGWDYGNGRRAPYGGMTAAGISSLTIALSHLDAPGDGGGRLDGALRTDIEQAIRGGFAWLSKWRAPRQVPGVSLTNTMNWWYYWLYSLERACELSNVGTIDGRDWYFDHAMIVLDAQQEDGSWGRFEDTCWAILFLKKAQLPVFTRPR